MSINKVILVGRLGANPEPRHFPQGGSICTFPVATSENWKDRQTGERKERTEWHQIVMRGGLVESASKYLKKGSQVYIEGAIRTRKWQDQNGQDKYSSEIAVETYRILGSRPESQGQSPSAQASRQMAAPSNQPPAPSDHLDGHIPF